MVFSHLMETIFQENPSFQLVETDIRAKNGFRTKERKAVNKSILFALNKSSDSTIWNEGFVKK